MMYINLCLIAFTGHSLKIIIYVPMLLRSGNGNLKLEFNQNFALKFCKVTPPLIQFFMIFEDIVNRIWINECSIHFKTIFTLKIYMLYNALHKVVIVEAQIRAGS